MDEIDRYGLSDVTAFVRGTSVAVSRVPADLAEYVDERATGRVRTSLELQTKSRRTPVDKSHNFISKVQPYRYF